MKKALTISVTFFGFFLVMAALLYLTNFNNVSTMTEIIIISLLADVAWHIMFYIVIPRLRKNGKE